MQWSNNHTFCECGILLSMLRLAVLLGSQLWSDLEGNYTMCASGSLLDLWCLSGYSKILSVKYSWGSGHTDSTLTKKMDACWSAVSADNMKSKGFSLS